VVKVDPARYRIERRQREESTGKARVELQGRRYAIGRRNGGRRRSAGLRRQLRNLEHFQEKWNPVFRPKMRQRKKC
jgi:hypothetical protein